MLDNMEGVAQDGEDKKATVQTTGEDKATVQTTGEDKATVQTTGEDKATVQTTGEDKATVQTTGEDKATGQNSRPQLYTWGLGKSGQLGTGEEQTEHTPQAVKLGGAGKRHAVVPKQVSCGGLYTAVLTHHGDLHVTGCGKYGRLATGNEENRCSFGQVSLPETVTQVSCGLWHGAAVTDSGAVLVWGHRKACGTAKEHTATGTAHTNTTLTPPSPLLSLSHHRVVGVACGYNFTVAWTAEGRGLSWGSGHHGVLGHGSTDDVPSPHVVETLKDEVIVQAGAGYSHCAFVTADGRVFSCGKGKDGALGQGQGHTADTLTPRLVTFPDHVQVVQVSCSVGEHHGHSLALTGDGKVYSWGDGYKGKLGLGNQDSHPTPTLVAPSHFHCEPVSVVCAGGIHSAAATSTGSVFTWGCGSDGRLGHPEGQGHRYLFRSDVPKKVESLTSKSKHAVVSCSYYHTAAIIA